MPRSNAEPFAGRPLLDIASYGRTGPGRRDRIGRADLETILWTARRAPVVMVKVLTKGGARSPEDRDEEAREKVEVERVRALPAAAMRDLDDGLRLVLGI